MDQTRATSALEPFLLQVKAASAPRYAAELITQATSSPNVYVFAELLETPNIQALGSSDEYAPYLKLLEIFAWGTFADYQSTPNLPKLSPAQHLKLQQLSLLPLAHQQTPLPYATLSSALSLSSPEELESLVTSAIYASLLTGSLDPAHQLVHIDTVAPLRDIAPGTLSSLEQTFAAWSQRCEAALADLAALEEEVQQGAAARARRDGRFEELFAARVGQAQEDAERASRSGKRVYEGTRGREGVPGEADEMDVDGGEGGRSKGTKRTLMGIAKTMGN